MTINKALEIADDLRPNAFTPDRKAEWVIAVDGRVNAEVVKATDYAAPEYPADQETELLVPSPYDDIDQIYVMAQIALYQKDYDEYNALGQTFNDQFKAYASYYNRTHSPAQPNSIKNLW
jgi:hypothetical protein